jgi:hypothetical protein
VDTLYIKNTTHIQQLAKNIAMSVYSNSANKDSITRKLAKVKENKNLVT